MQKRTSTANVYANSVQLNNRLSLASNCLISVQKHYICKSIQATNLIGNT